MSAVLKLFRSAEKKKKEKENVQAPGLEIGMPTQVSHNFSGKVNPDGTIGGIPESWKQRLKLMITTEEALNPQNAEKATQILKWIETRDDHTEEFMRVNSDSPPSSIVSSSGTNSGASFVSDTGEAQEDVNNASSSVVEPPVVPGLDNSVVNEPSKAVCDNELPTLRRKKKENHTTRQGPRVTRNLSEDQILSELQDCCIIGSPWVNYRKVSALFILLSLFSDPPRLSNIFICIYQIGDLGVGAAGVVTLGIHKETGEKVGREFSHLANILFSLLRSRLKILI